MIKDDKLDMSEARNRLQVSKLRLRNKEICRRAKSLNPARDAFNFSHGLFDEQLGLLISRYGHVDDELERLGMPITALQHTMCSFLKQLTGDFHGALKEMRIAIDKEPSDVFYGLRLAKLLYYTEKIDSAREKATELLASPNLAVKPGAYRILLDTEDNGLEIVESALTDLRGAPPFPRIKAEKLRAVGEFNEAVMYISKILKSDSDDYTTRAEFALNAALSGNTADARRLAHSSLILPSRTDQTLLFLDELVAAHKAVKILESCYADGMRRMSEQPLPDFRRLFPSSVPSWLKDTLMPNHLNDYGVDSRTKTTQSN